MVGEEGIEPSLRWERDFESRAYTSSATRPNLTGKLYQVFLKNKSPVAACQFLSYLIHGKMLTIIMNDEQDQSDKPRTDSIDAIRDQIEHIFEGNQRSENTARDLTDDPDGNGIRNPGSRTMIDRNQYFQDPPKQPREDAEIQATRERYHDSWQQYYQKYYENYYVNAVAQQNREFNKKLSELETNRKPVADSETSTSGATSSVVVSSPKQTAVKELRNDLLGKIRQNAQKVHKSRHFIPAICAIVVVLLIVFIQYNQLLFGQVRAFISPGLMTDQTIIIGTGAGQPVSPDPRVIIPKINVSAPVIYGLEDLSESTAQEALKRGVIHYPIYGASAYPGQNGNTVLLGHSSSDWFSDGQFKFIFVQLNRLTEGDLFYLDYEGVRYVYRIFKTEIINPDQVDKLAIGTDKPYATLITCDPPGTAFRRLVVYAEQIAPDPSNATAQQGGDRDRENNSITGNPPTLFERLFR